MSDSDDSLTQPDWTEPEWSVPDASPAPWRAARGRRTPVEPVRGRTAAVVGAIATVIAVGVVAAAAGTPAPAPAPAVADGVGVAPAGSYSSSAFCSAGAGTAATSTIYLTNSTTSAVRGVVTAVGPAASGVPCPPCAVV